MKIDRYHVIGGVIGIMFTIVSGCQASKDPSSLFPIQHESKDYQDGFRAGFYEGLTYNHITP